MPFITLGHIPEKEDDHEFDAFIQKLKDGNVDEDRIKMILYFATESQTKQIMDNWVESDSEMNDNEQ